MPVIPRTEFDETDGLVMSVEPTVSATECTGLIPRGGVDESGAEAYDELYDIHIDREDRDDREVREVREVREAQEDKEDSEE